MNKEDIMTLLKTVGLIASLVASFKGGDFMQKREGNEQLKNLGPVIAELVEQCKEKEVTQ